MFGYIRICKPELLVKEFDIYKSIYCGFCKVLGKKYGRIMRLFLSYDAVFVAVLGIAISGEKIKVQKRRCVANPIKSCLFCSNNEDSLTFAAAVMTVLTYYKLDDDVRDSKFIKKFGVSVIKAIIKRNYNIAKRMYPKLDEICSEYISNQCKIEKQCNVDVDKAALPTADMLSNVFSMLSEDVTQKLILKQFGFYVGRWIYLIDAIDDLEKDREQGTFNPFLSVNLENKDEKIFKNSILNLTIAQAVSAYNLMNVTKLKGILDNIVYKGFSMMQKQIIFDKCHNKKSNKGR